ncbi:hypothetical protein N7452_010127 [Penicillium brevicompactum]|uniref:Uncharacterized protein n=1 Tax=Penicillium brevicompactum TaxID=5074 RepID=A0A9W9QEN2_PENBR|nr:hypothetical protein N7452_010127 [Penicillium brevicompactum]
MRLPHAVLNVRVTFGSISAGENRIEVVILSESKHITACGPACESDVHEPSVTCSATCNRCEPGGGYQVGFVTDGPETIRHGGGHGRCTSPHPHAAQTSIKSSKTARTTIHIDNAVLSNVPRTGHIFVAPAVFEVCHGLQALWQSYDELFVLDTSNVKHIGPNVTAYIGENMSHVHFCNVVSESFPSIAPIKHTSMASLHSHMVYSREGRRYSTQVEIGQSECTAVAFSHWDAEAAVLVAYVPIELHLVVFEQVFRVREVANGQVKRAPGMCAAAGGCVAWPKLPCRIINDGVEIAWTPVYVDITVPHSYVARRGIAGMPIKHIARQIISTVNNSRTVDVEAVPEVCAIGNGFEIDVSERGHGLEGGIHHVVTESTTKPSLKLGKTREIECAATKLPANVWAGCFFGYEQNFGVAPGVELPGVRRHVCCTWVGR